MMSEQNDRHPAPRRRVLLGYDGSLGALEAIQVGALLLPHFPITLMLLWDPALRPSSVRTRLAAQAGSPAELINLLEQEGTQEARRLAEAGVVLAQAAGWTPAEGRIRRSHGRDGLLMAQLAEEQDAALVVVGSRGLSGAGAALGSFSDTLVHHSTVPVLVVPHPLLSTEREAAADGPVVIGWDGSEGARAALLGTLELFPDRQFVVTSVGNAGDPAEGVALAEGEGARATPVRLAPLARSVGGGRDTADMLSALARARDAAAIVVGSRGRSTALDLLLGSVALATLHRAQRPVVVVPGSQPEADQA